MHESDLTDLWLTLTCPAICLIRNSTTEKRDERIFSSWEIDEEPFASPGLATHWPISWPKSVSYWPWAITIVKKKGEPRYVGCIIHKDRVKKKRRVRWGSASEGERNGEREETRVEERTRKEIVREQRETEEQKREKELESEQNAKSRSERAPLCTAA